jgi:hypothetical protein
VQDPDDAEKIMWGEVVSKDGFHVMAYDVPSATAFDPGEIPYFISVRLAGAEEITASWDAPSPTPRPDAERSGSEPERQGRAGKTRLLPDPASAPTSGHRWGTASRTVAGVRRIRPDTS